MPIGLPVESTMGEALRRVTPIPPVGLDLRPGSLQRVDVTIRTTERLPHGVPIDVEMTEAGVTFRAVRMTVVGSLSVWPHRETRYRLRCEESGASFELRLRIDDYFVRAEQEDGSARRGVEPRVAVGEDGS
jgi:hypothetical protein